MALHEDGTSQAQRDVTVFLGDEAPVRQPGTFRCCPLGVQFYTPNEVDQYRVLDVELHLDAGEDSPGDVSCQGVVVHCARMDDSGLFRVWVFFLDLPDAVRDHLHCIAKDSEVLCPFCENF